MSGEQWPLGRTVQIATLVAVGISTLISLSTIVWVGGTMSQKIVALQRSDVAQWVEINAGKSRDNAMSLSLGKIQANTERSARQLDQIFKILLEDRNADR